MAYIKLAEGVPGIKSLVLFRPETGKHLYGLVQILLRGPSTLPEADRELIAAYVSFRNECRFCAESHAAAARELYRSTASVVDDVLANIENAPIEEKLKALLKIAGKVQVLGKELSEEEILNARKAGATDREIHDTVLIAATFSMLNRYVDGLGTSRPSDPKEYIDMGKRLSSAGYKFPNHITS